MKQRAPETPTEYPRAGEPKMRESGDNPCELVSLSDESGKIYTLK